MLVVLIHCCSPVQQASSLLLVSLAHAFGGMAVAADPKCICTPQKQNRPDRPDQTRLNEPRVRPNDDL